MRSLLLLVIAVLALSAFGAPAAEIDPAVITMFQELSLPAPAPGNVIVCHGYNCNFRTQVGLSPRDHARLAELMSAGRTSPEAERGAIARASVWFEKRVAPLAGTANAKARSGGGIHLGGDPSQFDCIDTTTNTNALLIVLDKLGLLRHHQIEAPISRLWTGGGPHFTAVIKDRRSGQKWTVDPWTHDNGQLPDVWPVERWSAGG